MGREEATVRLPAPAPEGEAGESSTSSSAATSRTGTHRRRNTLLASGPVALVVAVVAGSLLLSPMLNGSARWPAFAGSGLNWPLSSLSWPGGHPPPPQEKGKPVVAASPTHTPSHSPTPHFAAATPEPTAEPAAPTPEPTRAPVSTPTPPRPTPTPTPVPTPTPTPQPTPTPPLFADTFATGIGSTWTPRSGTWTPGVDGIPVAKGSNTSPDPDELAVMTAGGRNWTDITITAKVKPSSVGFAGVIARYEDSADNFYFCGLDYNKITVGKYLNGSRHTESVSFPHTPNQFYDVTFTVKGGKMTCTVTNPLNPTMTATHVLDWPNYVPNGAIGLIGKPYAEFGVVVVRPA